MLHRSGVACAQQGAVWGVWGVRLCACSVCLFHLRTRKETFVCGAPQVGPEDHVICALSGGVDSTVAATLVHRVLGDRLHCVFVDNGLLRCGGLRQQQWGQSSNGCAAAVGAETSFSVSNRLLRYVRVGEAAADTARSAGLRAQQSML